MDWSEALIQVIDLRSFSSVWYWIGLAVVWSSVSHWVLGVPFDLIMRARKNGGEDLTDMMDLVRINVRRMLTIAQTAGFLLTGFVSFVLTSLVVLGFYYDVELAQAIFLIALPLTIVGAVSLSTSRLIYARDPEPDALFPILLRHRVWTQIIGMAAIFVTAMYGMYQNLQVIRGL